MFITEGIFDALSFENINLKGIALNSITMVNKFLLAAENYKDILIKNDVVFVVALDNDPPKKILKDGQYILKDPPVDAARKKLSTGLKEIGLKSIVLTFKYKDVNEYYTKNSNAFVDNIYKIVDAVRKKDG